MSYARPDGGSNDMSPTNGWNASLTVNLNEWFGVVIDGRGNYTRFSDEGTVFVIPAGQEDTPEPTLEQTTQTRTSSARAHSFTVGMRFTLRENEKIHPFYHALFGVRHFGSDDFAEYTPGHYRLPTQDELKVDPELDKVWVPELNHYYFDIRDNFLMVFGGGIDIVINPKFSIRAFQADYQIERETGDFIPYLNFATGLVYNIGER